VTHFEDFVGYLLPPSSIPKNTNPTPADQIDTELGSEWSRFGWFDGFECPGAHLLIWTRDMAAGYCDDFMRFTHDV
jgi:hypothetical protein